MTAGAFEGGIVWAAPQVLKVGEPTHSRGLGAPQSGRRLVLGSGEGSISVLLLFLFDHKLEKKQAEIMNVDL